MDWLGKALVIFCVFIAFDLTWASSKRVVCYYTNWSAYRPGLAKFLPQNINPYLCTHLIYAFGGFSNEYMLKPFDKWQDIDQGGYAKFNGLKVYNKDLKTLLAVGGWNEGSNRFSKLVNDPESRQKFIKSALRYLRQHNFDGIDLDWEYPASRDGSKPTDRANYALLVRELREEFNKESSGSKSKLLLTMAVPAGEELLVTGYDLKSLNRDLDWMNVMAYDYHSSGEPQVNHHAPLTGLEDPSAYDPNEFLNVDATVKLYIRNGASPNKLSIGIPTYGRAYKLLSSDATDIGSPAQGPAEAGKATREKGYLAYYEICEKIGVNGWSVRKPDPDAYGPIAYDEHEWVGYDDEAMAAKKAQYVLDKGLGGIMFWSIDNDDFRGLCTGKQYPLIESAKAALLAHNEEPVEDKNSRSSSGSKMNRPSSGQLGKISATSQIKSSSLTTTTPAPPTTPKNAVDFVCKEEGFYSNPEDCTRYFWCLDTNSVGLVSHSFTCPSGLYFNKYSDSCDYVNNVVCQTSVLGDSTTLKPFLSQSTTLSARRKINRVTTMTTTTTTTLAPDSESSESGEVAESSSKELKELLKAIKSFGGVEAIKQLLDGKVDNRSSQESTTGQPIDLNLDQHPPPERIIEPVTSTTGLPSKDLVQSTKNAAVTTVTIRVDADHPMDVISVTTELTISERPTEMTTGNPTEPGQIDRRIGEELQGMEKPLENLEEHASVSTETVTTATMATTGASTPPSVASTTSRKIIIVTRRRLFERTSKAPIPSSSFPSVTTSTTASSKPIRVNSSDFRHRFRKLPTTDQPPESNLEKSTDPSAESTDSSSAGRGSRAVVEIDERGQVLCHDTGYFAHPGDCKKFVQCLRNASSGPIQGQVHSCPHTWNFDEDGGKCNSYILPSDC